METFKLVIQSFIKVSNYPDLIKKLEEEDATTLLQYCFKAMELWHRVELAKLNKTGVDSNEEEI